MWLVLRTEEEDTGFLDSTSEGKRPIVRVRLKWIFKKWDGEAWTELICLRRGADAWRLRMQ